MEGVARLQNNERETQREGHIDNVTRPQASSGPLAPFRLAAASLWSVARERGYPTWDSSVDMQVWFCAVYGFTCQTEVDLCITAIPSSLQSPCCVSLISAARSLEASSLDLSSGHLTWKSMPGAARCTWVCRTKQGFRLSLSSPLPLALHAKRSSSCAVPLWGTPVCKFSCPRRTVIRNVKKDTTMSQSTLDQISYPESPAREDVHSLMWIFICSSAFVSCQKCPAPSTS